MSQELVGFFGVAIALLGAQFAAFQSSNQQLSQIRDELSSKNAELRGEIASSRAELREQMTAMKSDIMRDMDRLGHELEIVKGKLDVVPSLAAKVEIMATLMAPKAPPPGPP